MSASASTASRPARFSLGRLFRWHRRIALFAALPVLLWALSGLSHPIMTRLFPSAAVMQPPHAGQPAPARLSLASVLAQQGVTEVSEARLMAHAGQPYWQFRIPDSAERRYVNALTGQVWPQGDRDYAIVLARHFVGDADSPVRNTRLLTRFDDDYAAVNRLLPVWRVEFDRPDGLRAYVETSPPRLAALMDDRKALFQRLFRALHSWDFLDHAPLLRKSMMSLCLLAAIAMQGLGLWVWLRQSARAQAASGALARWHRRLGLIALLAGLAFLSSGLLHVWLAPAFQPPRQVAARHAAAWLTASPLTLPVGATLVKVGDQSAWRLPTARAPRTADAPHAHLHDAPPKASPHIAAVYLDASQGKPLPDGERQHLRTLVQTFGYAFSPTASLETVTRFAGEYGFINKRLPVVRISPATPGSPTLYVEAATGSLASQVGAADRLEGYSFAWLHKAHWLDPLGKNLRDVLLGFFALLNTTGIVLGMALWWQRRRNGPACLTKR